jgi:hypothetical protein
MTKGDMLECAEECRQYAERSNDIETKASYLAAAKTWFELASLADEAGEGPKPSVTGAKPD